MNESRPQTAVPAWLCLALPAGLLLAPPARIGEGDEPPVRYFLEREGTRTQVLLDRPFELEVDGKKLVYTLRAAPTRVLELPALRLEYPRHMPFEYESDDGYTAWTMDGNDAILTVQRLAAEAELDVVFTDFAESMKGMFGDGVQSEQPVELELDGRTLRGRRLQLVISGTDIHMELFPLCVHGDAAYLLTLQDTPDDEGKATEEMGALRRILLETFRFRGGE